MTADLLAPILALPELRVPFGDFEADAAAVAERVDRELELDRDPRLGAIEIVRAGFCRNRGAYVVGGMEATSTGRPRSCTARPCRPRPTVR